MCIKKCTRIFGSERGVTQHFQRLQNDVWRSCARWLTGPNQNRSLFPSSLSVFGWLDTTLVHYCPSGLRLNWIVWLTRQTVQAGPPPTASGQIANQTGWHLGWPISYRATPGPSRDTPMLYGFSVNLFCQWHYQCSVFSSHNSNSIGLSSQWTSAEKDFEDARDYTNIILTIVKY